MNVLAVATTPWRDPPLPHLGQMLWFVDDRDLRELVADAEAQQEVQRPGNYWGARTGFGDDVVRMALGRVAGDPLCFYEDGQTVPAYAWLLTCECGEPGHLGLDFSFDAQQNR